MQRIVSMSLAPVAVIAAAAIFFLAPLRFSMLIYPLARQAAQSKMNYDTRHYAQLESEHFIVRFKDNDRQMAQMAADAAERAYQPVTGLLGRTMQGKTLIVMYPDRSELRKAFGWSGDESAMGVYWGGVIQILSPRDWMKDKLSTDEFIRSGPMVHEFTHLVFDHMTRGNYSRWFTEGLAQYVEYKVNGYEWLTAVNSLQGRLYSLEELRDDFDDMPNQSLAYREAFAAVRYIAEVHGEAALQQVVQALSAGKSESQAIQQVLGVSMPEFELKWQQWAVNNMNTDR